MNKDKKLTPYTQKTVDLTEKNLENILHKIDDVILPDPAEKSSKSKVFLNVIIDGTYSMESIYAFVYSRLHSEAEELKKLNREVLIKTIVMHDSTIQNMGEYGNIEKFQKDILAIEIYGGSNDGFEPYLNNALAETAVDLQDISDNDIKFILLITDSMPGADLKTETTFDENICNKVILAVNDPDSASNEFVYMNNMTIVNIRDFLMSKENNLLYKEIKILEKTV